jgi:hypothetical protein
MGATLIGNIYVDATIKATPSAPLKVSAYPIEDGSLVAGYVAEDVETLTLECAFADDALVSSGDETRADRPPSRLTTAADKRQAIKDLKKSRQLVNITMLDFFFPNMLLLDIQEDITTKNVKGFRPVLVFQNIKTVKTGTTAVPIDRLKKKPVAKQTAADKQRKEQDLAAQETDAMVSLELDSTSIDSGVIGP